MKNHLIRLNLFEKWLDDNHHIAEELIFPFLVQYQAYLNERGQKRATIANYLHTVKLYYKYLQDARLIIDSPAEQLVMKGTVRTIPRHVLSPEELEDLYFSYEIDRCKRSNHTYSIRNKTVVGFLVYQVIKPTNCITYE